MWALFLGQPNSVVRKTELDISYLPVASLDLGTMQDAGSIGGMISTLLLSVWKLEPYRGGRAYREPITMFNSRHSGRALRRR